MGLGRTLQILFGIVCCINLAIWSLIFWLLIRTVITGASVPFPVLTAISLFLLSFLAASVLFQLFMRQKAQSLLVTTLVLIVFQFISVLILSFTLFSDDRHNIDYDFKDNPLGFVRSRRWISLSLCFIFVPIFLVQVLYLNHHLQQLHSAVALEPSEGGYKRKATPYHGKNEYVSSVVVG
ncbi:unnamed protein product [Bursaphelenchus okinawaensis]|uniref:Uncharacterized protein n=1 Tax=Bursaphelenchus okinawaensis TaxID=465554 RepID=A0A811JRW7_9BILA|nr:unnamed protein product [Bursaphelenchus okinawaensis]CAG9080776.1 unnamed protein product [Bursaphelenchus okinawaensis]